MSVNFCGVSEYFQNVILVSSLFAIEEPVNSRKTSSGHQDRLPGSRLSSPPAGAFNAHRSDWRLVPAIAPGLEAAGNGAHEAYPCEPRAWFLIPRSLTKTAGDYPRLPVHDLTDG